MPNTRHYPLKKYIVFFLMPMLLLQAFLPQVLSAKELTSNVVTGTDSTAQLPFWEWQSQGMSIRLVQRLPDQTRGYFMARGFNKTQAEQIAQACVFQTIYKNSAPAGNPLVIDYDLTKWRVATPHGHFSLKLREDWEQQWERDQVDKRARIAMQWSLLPTRQHYLAQDYNWGMISFNLPPGTKFDLELSWMLNGNNNSGRIPGIICAPDIHPEPTETLK